jgi:hypothetical protein
LFYQETINGKALYDMFYYQTPSYLTKNERHKRAMESIHITYPNFDINKMYHVDRSIDNNDDYYLILDALLFDYHNLDRLLNGLFSSIIEQIKKRYPSAMIRFQNIRNDNNLDLEQGHCIMDVYLSSKRILDLEDVDIEVVEQIIESTLEPYSFPEIKLYAGTNYQKNDLLSQDSYTFKSGFITIVRPTIDRDSSLEEAFIRSDFEEYRDSLEGEYRHSDIDYDFRYDF